ncbi:unnamed protein product [Pleuronectes platessa]|uniref:Uncharacterized protein n=1 Tax=Pleuronectes platessa TaxID=8262 RepID=A0A9N7W5M2_PLEPL|nr:unnamed protein product [Pleuronectes platessa]
MMMVIDSVERESVWFLKSGRLWLRVERSSSNLKAALILSLTSSLKISINTYNSSRMLHLNSTFSNSPSSLSSFKAAIGSKPRFSLPYCLPPDLSLHTTSLFVLAAPA